MIAEEMGFEKVVPVSGQTYSRKMDAQVLAVLSGIAQSASKFSNDMRILQNFKEMEEPFEKIRLDPPQCLINAIQCVVSVSRHCRGML